MRVATVTAVTAAARGPAVKRVDSQAFIDSMFDRSSGVVSKFITDPSQLLGAPLTVLTGKPVPSTQFTPRINERQAYQERTLVPTRASVDGQPAEFWSAFTKRLLADELPGVSKRIAQYNATHTPPIAKDVSVDVGDFGRGTSIGPGNVAYPPASGATYIGQDQKLHLTINKRVQNGIAQTVAHELGHLRNGDPLLVDEATQAKDPLKYEVAANRECGEIFAKKGIPLELAVIAFSTQPWGSALGRTIDAFAHGYYAKAPLSDAEKKTASTNLRALVLQAHASYQRDEKSQQRSADPRGRFGWPLH
ncbi:MAG: hypothetical protein K1X89_06295 [Myxococcaceae bacterium]|nr:hypothetical protein [Myxococcaceae bacterium]